MKGTKKVDLDWANLGFTYTKTDKRFVATYKGNAWDKGKLVSDNYLKVIECSPGLHYAQQFIEGLKAHTAEDGRILLFRPEQNAKRFIRSAKALCIPEVPEELFLEGITKTVKANFRWIPPYGKGASLYIRPFQIGVGENIGVNPAKECLFCVFVIPVGPYYKGGFNPVKIKVTDYDRAAPNGTGGDKLGANYAASLRSLKEARGEGFNDCLYLDPATKTNIEELGAANFIGITKDNVLVTPKSSSILPSITKYSILHLAKHQFGMKVEERPIPITEIDQFSEAFACGTAAVVTPIGTIQYQGKEHTFYNSGQEAGPITKRLYQYLLDIQLGKVEGPEGWVYEVKM